NMESFFAAIENGADAVYFGLEEFSARAGAQNFTLDNASKAIACAHRRSVKVYIALNTLLKTHELERVVDFLIALEELQPDALILQDLGLLNLLQSQFPQFKLHASTQMAIHNLAGVKQLEKAGFKRVVLARELSVDEMKNISRNSSVEIEVFIHGALCYSYSGLCFFSSMIGGRSGNRGRCAQPCRMYYKSPTGEGGYLFSMKDLLALSRITDLMTTGVHSFKIEGRMKSPEYVAVVTDIYRQAIDGRLCDEADAIRRIKTVFSRETTHAYLFQESYQQTERDTHNKSAHHQAENNFSFPPYERAEQGVVINSPQDSDKVTIHPHHCPPSRGRKYAGNKCSPPLVGGVRGGDELLPDKIEQLPEDNQVKAADMINPAYPANIGSYAGEVIKSEKGHIVIKADADIGVRDLLQVFEQVSAKPTLLHVKAMKMQGKKVFGIKSGDVAAIDSDQQVRPGAKLYIISSQKINEVFTPKIPKKLIPAKIAVDLDIKIMSDGIGIRSTIKAFSFVKDYPVKLEKGMNRVIGEEQIREVFSRLGETPFELARIHAEISEKVFVPLSLLNEIRRDYFKNLLEVWQKERAYRCEEIKKWVKGKCIELSNPDHNFSAGNVSTEEYRLSVKIDKLPYLNTISLEKMYKVYIVLTDEIIRNLTKKAEGFSPPSPSSQGWDRGGGDLSSDETVTPFMMENDSIDLLLKIKDKVVFSLPVIMRDNGCGFETYAYFKKALQVLIAQNFRQFQISNLGAMGLFEGEDVLLYADYPLYCLNPLSAMKLREWGFTRYTVSPEDDKENLRTLFSEDADVIMYQDIPLFTSNTCVWANMKRRCPGMNQCSFKQLMVENEYGDRFMAMNDRCKTVVIGERPFSIIQHIPKLLDAGQGDFRVDLCYRDYTPEMIVGIFSGIQNRTTMKYSTMGNYERGLL
ncbi:MAG: family peptidase, partial [Planctomycetota bacterium]|nr:family peptidase [Planctomycetota bacterium]